MPNKKHARILRGVLILLIIAGLVASAISACGDKDILDPRNPVTLTLWHTYSQQLNESMSMLVEEFNNTVGAERGIIVQVAYIADAREVNDRLMMAAHETFGAPELPDIAVIYPRIGITLAEMGLLVDLNEQFSEEELDAFVSDFLDEGRLGRDGLYILPIAKSTEVMYVNATIYDRFAEETGYGYAHLETMEGIIDAAERYYEWSGGKALFYPEGMFNLALVGFEQLGDEFITGRELNLSSPAFQRL